MRRPYKLVSVLLAGSLLGAAGGCESKAGTGALVGAGGGALVGGAIGSMSHARFGEGALIGGAIGAIGGAIVGNEMDKSDKREQEKYEQSYRETGRYNSSTDSRHMTKDDVIAWTARGDKEEIIIDRIERSGQTFDLSARDENQLRDAGVSDEVIRSMKNSGRK